MATQSPTSDSNKRLKTTIQPNPQNQCAICFVDIGDDDDKPSRGEIDCCDHEFCFLCIMEWARTESRCPLCRRRFTSIRRPPKPSVFSRDRVVSIPIRDQACNAVGSSDPYGEITCYVCCGSEDDFLLLLCDLCDSASHTYCVGLGVTVPEGDWYCHECELSRAERANCEKETEEDIKCKLVAEKFPPIVSSRSEQPTNKKAIAPKKVTRSKLSIGVSKKVSTDSSARTLDRCRSVHSRISAMRENWKAMRIGLLGFSSAGFHTACHYSQKHKNNAVSEQRSTQVESSSSTNSQSKVEFGNGSYDIDRAWKMMDMAKSKQYRTSKTSTLQSSNVPSGETSASKEMNWQVGYNSLGRTELETLVKGKETKKSQFFELDKETRQRIIINKAEQFSSTLSAKCSSRLSENSLAENITSGGDKNSEEHRSMWFQDIMNQDSSNVANNRDDLSSSVGQVVFDSIDVRSEINTGSSIMDPPRHSITSKNNDTQHGDAKSEIQSLVKLNLKILTKEKRLGVDLFKEIARLATHTVLAACGLEHNKKYGSYSVTSSVSCSHIELSQECPKSNLMPKYCPPCFNSFVKDVVAAVMFDRVGCAKSS